MIRAGIMGATGYMGGEVLRVLLQHPEVDIAWACSRSTGDIAEYHPNLYGENIPLIGPEDVQACDVVFLALPTAATLPWTEKFLAMGCKVIDLGAAFRLQDRAVWERVYGMAHSQWSLIDEAVYGIAELHDRAIRRARLVANPGCFASAAILAMAPLVEHGLVDPEYVIVNGLSGTAGAGAQPSRVAHHPEIGNNLVAYNVVDHRHSYEMEQELSAIGQAPVTVHFTPVYVPIVRGILSVCHGFSNDRLDRAALLSLFKDYYRDSPFVKVYDLPKQPGAAWQYRPYPWVSSVIGSNYCYIGLDVDASRRRVVVFAVLDSVGKGGAQAGVENLNRLFGLDPTTGLTARATHP